MRHAVVIAVLSAAVTAWTCGSSALAEPPDTPLGALPRLSGVYRNSSQHPHVFMAPADLIDLVMRINSSGTFSARSFARLMGQIRIDLAARNEWERP